MEIKHYTLFSGSNGVTPYIYVRIGSKDFYLSESRWRIIKITCILSLTSAILFAIV